MTDYVNLDKFNRNSDECDLCVCVHMHVIYLKKGEIVFFFSKHVWICLNEVKVVIE